ncbi:hypothetical protein B0O80DRAFT_446024 [Mortierella sp. GBAus27b]|nr:hypothetical protein B0O80DRAFT_446024 [Mortierella sp. GBAus27b]
MHSKRASHQELDNPNVDEYLRQEGMTDEEWKRIYDLRYCTILVPYEEGQDETQDSAVDHKESADKGVSRTPQTVTPISTPVTKGQRQLATPTSPQERRLPFVSSQRLGVVSKSPSPRHTGLLTPTEKQPSSLSGHRSTNQKSARIGGDQEFDSDDETKSFLTDSDPLSSYLTTSHLESQHTTNTILSKRTRTRLTTTMVRNEDIEAVEPETFHDALEQHDDLESESHTRHIHKQAEKSESTNVGKKRRHWEIETTRLLQPTQPDPQKRVALANLVSHSTTAVVPTGLSKPISFTPAPPTISWNRRGSTASDMSTVSRESLSRNVLWTTQDWRMVEKIYEEMNGDSMAELDLYPIVDRFLKEHEQKTGETPPWTRKKVHTRCVALQRVRQNKHCDSMDHDGHRFSRESTPQLAESRGFNRHTTQPYPLRNTRELTGGSTGKASSTISDFLSHRRADRNRRQQEAEQNYQLKSVFKHRLASGMRTVGQLLPFWKDVEKGNLDIKEKVAIPLVPAGKAQAVIEAFETQSIDTRSECSWSDSGCSSRGHGRARSSVSSLPPPETIAEMLARGHASRSESTSSSSS